MTDIVQSCVDRIMRGDISIIPVDFTLVELLFKIGEDTLIVEKLLTIGILLLNQKTKNRSQGDKVRIKFE